jgi:hypothetical protein
MHQMFCAPTVAELFSIKATQWFQDSVSHLSGGGHIMVAVTFGGFALSCGRSTFHHQQFHHTNNVSAHLSTLA